ncbi:MAG: MFS transporter [Oscillospiraceae bacterium]|nr:MFS transporter [Oscillospiraceae bacterium]
MDDRDLLPVEESTVEVDPRWHTRTADKFARKLKVNDDGREELQQLLTNPVVWARGEELPDGHLAPWEKLTFGLGHFFAIASGGFDRRDQLWRFTFNVNPNYITMSGFILSIVDAINDFFIGQFMDRRPFQDKTYRKIIRTMHVIGSFMGLFWMLDMGFTPIQRVVMFTIAQALLDAANTVAGISRQKFLVGITPFSSERSKIWTWQETGGQFGWPIGNLPSWIMGFARDRQVWTDYRIFTRGYMITLPLRLASGIVNTFARNRVDVWKKMEDERALRASEGKEEEKLSFLQTMRAIRHNKFLLYNTVQGFIRIFIPGVDEYPIYRFLVPDVNLFGRQFRAETIPPVRNQISGTPMTFMLPFMDTIVKRMGGARRFQIISSSIMSGGFVAKYLMGYNGAAAIITIFAVDIFSQNLGMLTGFSNRIMEFEFLDYVEYKTGQRTEGLNTTFHAFVNTVIKRNIGSFTDNFFQAWTQIYQIDVMDPNAVAPERFRRWAWLLFTLAPAFDNLMTVINRSLLKYDPKDRIIIEAELKRRRDLVEQAKQELNATQEQEETVSTGVDK